MKEQKLISMVDKLGELESQLRQGLIGADDFVNISLHYKDFLSQPLTLGMFVPCGDDGKVLEEPEEWEEYKITGDVKGVDITKHVIYQQAKERVLFEGFDSFQAEEICKRFSRVELIAKGIITLTQNAIKTIYG